MCGIWTLINLNKDKINVKDFLKIFGHLIVEVLIILL